MARRKKSDEETPSRPPMTPEARENQMIALAMDLAEKQLREGTASAQVIAHYLKLGSSKEKLEKEKLAREVEHLEAKTDSLQSAKHIEELYTEAMEAFRGYRSSVEGSDDSDIF